MSAKLFLGVVIALLVSVLLVSLLFPSGWKRIPYDLELYDSIWAHEETVRGVLEANERRFLVISQNESEDGFHAQYLTWDEVQRIQGRDQYVKLRENPWFYKLESSRGVIAENNKEYVPVRYGGNLPGGPNFLEEFAGKEVELFGKWHDIKRDHTPDTTLIFGSEFIPKRIREARDTHDQ